jgi:hypothetical protein
MAIPTSRTTFIDYCLRSLGAPVIEINVADEQVSDRVDDSLELFSLFHMDASERVFMTHTFTAQDLANSYITLTPPILSVISVVFPGSGLASNWASGVWQYQADVFADLGFSSGAYKSELSDYVIRMSSLGNLSQTLANLPRIQHVMHAGKLLIDDNWAQFKIGDVLMMECYIALDPETYESVWNDKWLKDYATALIGRQWGQNLQKYQGVELPGGITLNGDAIYTQYDTRIKELEEDLETRYSFPPDFFMG